MNELVIELCELAQDRGIFYSKMLEAVAWMIGDLAEVAENDKAVLEIQKKVLALALELNKHEY